MGVKAITLSNSASTPIPLTDANGNHISGPAKIWNPVDSAGNVAIHQNAAAGATPVTETHSTASLTVVTDTTLGEVEIPDATRFVDDAGKFWDADTGEGVTNPPATAGTATVTLSSTDTTDAAAVFPEGTLVCKTGEHVTGPHWATDAIKTLPRATFGTAVVRFTQDNDAQAILIAAGTPVKKAAVATPWETDATSNTARATQSTASATLGFDTSAGAVTVPAGSAVKVAAAAGNWLTDAEVIAAAATYSVAVVELVGVAGTVIAAGKRVNHAGGSIYWALDAEQTIPASGFVDAAVTCTTIGAQAAAAGHLDTIHDAVVGWTGVENEAAATVGVTAAPTASVGLTCVARGATAAAIGAIDTIVDAVAGWSSVTNPGAAVPGLPIVASVDLAVTCATRGAIAAVAASLNTLPTPVTGVSAVSNPADATPGLTTTPSTTVGVTCQTKGAIAALATTLNTFVHPEDLETGTSVSNAAPATPGDTKDFSNTIAVTAVTGGAIAAGTGDIDALETPIVGVVSVTNAAPATPGLDEVIGSVEDFVLPPGSGHPFDGSIATMQGKSLGAAPIVVQLLTGADAMQDDARIATQAISGSVGLTRDVTAVLVGDHATTTGDTAPTTVAHGYALPTTGARETIVLAASIAAAGAGTITGTCWLWNALATTPAWYPVRAITFGNATEVAADTDQLTGAVAEVAWPRGITRVCWQTTAETGAPSARRMTITA